MSQEKIKNVIEAALMVSTQPLSTTRLLNLFEGDLTLQPERNNIRAAIEELQQDYQERGIELAEVASGFRFQARDEYAQWVNHLFDERPPRYSRALLETLSIIAYRQPITRGEIEEIRGVSVSSNIVKTLQEREWIKVVGHRDVPGKPELLATTNSFLDYFNLKRLTDLPALADIKDFDSINPDLFEDFEENESDIGKPDEADNEAANDFGKETVESVDNNVETVSESVDEIATESESPEESDEIKDSVDEEDDVVEQGAKVIPFSG